MWVFVYFVSNYLELKIDALFNMLFSSLQNLELTQEARKMRTMSDEMDVLHERANKVQHLELELQSYKDRISQMESIKSRLEEVKEENKILVETKIMLEDQLERSGKRCQQIMSLENELFRYKSELNNAQVIFELIIQKSKYNQSHCNNLLTTQIL